MRRKLCAGNWKMNGTPADLAEVAALIAAHPAPSCEVLICPPATLLAQMAWASRGSSLRLGGQTCHAAASGAHTGDISAGMLAAAGASHVIVGHSERRSDHGESDADIAAKVAAVWAAGLTAVLCIGETLAQRDTGDTLAVIARQLAEALPDAATPDATVIAYEPVWAIGTGRTPTIDQIDAVHGFLRDSLAKRFGPVAADGFRLLYGGSVKPGNAGPIFALADVDGALVGGASLKAADFGPIIAALDAA